MFTWIALVLIIIGAINWGLIGLFGCNIVEKLFGGPRSIVTRIIYSLIGLSGIFTLVMLFLRR
ncbi:protein of unknown function DUF378 [Alkaliphilus metalliredigens QYMF]|uniref:DUF378 domain-containing protein n=1 Tax=Alkaliphilus metalliredigens (strain QYMF) TaxID=293826 RepID=A6TUE0_ALKMQ|nr:DUF378 domain-containing protein [Alkaliphilus metalliredigens]ABR49808.1 protein of unknown function DUF378 [Alkaliphilus metalliredigens QYMF]